jgi:hypothetical protein
VKKKTQEWYRKKCVGKAKIEAKEKVDYTCEHCGRSKAQGWQVHGSHIYSEGCYKSMSAEVDNILCLCATCHTGGFFGGSTKPSWHEDPIYFTNWFNEKYPERAERLKLMARETKVINWELRWKEINEGV